MLSRRRWVFLLGFLLFGQIVFSASMGRTPDLVEGVSLDGQGEQINKGLLLLAQQQDSSTVALDDYWRLVEETLALVNSLESTTPETAHTQLGLIAEEWAGITAVSTADNEIIQLDHAFLLAKFRADPPDLTAVSGFLEAMLAAQASWPSATHNLADLDPLSDLLSKEEFQWPEAAREPNRFGDLLGRFFQWLDDVFPDTGLNLGGAWLGNLLGIVGAVVLAAVLFFAFRGLFLDFIAESDLREREALEEEMLTAETALKKAQTLSSGGDYRMAVRYLYLSTLLIMEERGLFRYDRAKTNREYLRSLQGRPELVLILGDVVEVFDRVWYGYQPLSQTDYNQYQTRVEALRRQE